MSETLLITQDGPRYKDGDILFAFDPLRTRRTHAEHICAYERFGGGVKVPRPLGTLGHDFMRAVYQYENERISRTQMKRTELATGVVDVFGPPEFDVPLHVELCLLDENHAIFGSLGKEIWYGGHISFTHATMDLVWSRINHHLGFVESSQQFQLWPMGFQDIRSFLAVRHDDITDDEAEELMSPLPELDNNGRQVWELTEIVEHTHPYNPINPNPPNKVHDWTLRKKIDLAGNILPDVWVWADRIPKRRASADDESNLDPPAENHVWMPVEKAKRKHRVNWRELLGDLNVTEAQVLDSHFSVGRDIKIRKEKFRHESKEQKRQTPEMFGAKES